MEFFGIDNFCFIVDIVEFIGDGDGIIVWWWFMYGGVGELVDTSGRMGICMVIGYVFVEVFIGGIVGKDDNLGWLL